MDFKNKFEPRNASITIRIPKSLKTRLQEDSDQLRGKLPAHVRFTLSNYTHALLEYALLQDDHFDTILSQMIVKSHTDNEKERISNTQDD